MTEIRSYQDETVIWKVEPAIRNSAGVLVKHICGNLNANIGAEIGDTGYIRDRDAEFTAQPVTTDKLLAELEQTRQTVMKSLERLTGDQLDKKFSRPVSTGEYFTTRFMMMHLTTHLAYHLGQINYHRRLLD